MPDLGLDVIFKGRNAIRLLGGLGIALRISLIAVLISIPLGIFVGILMTFKNPIIKAVFRIYKNNAAACTFIYSIFWKHESTWS